jgi:hypothetical protein
VSASEKLFGPGRSRAFSPFLAPAERKELHEVLRFSGASTPSFADELRSLARRYIDDGDSLKLRTVCLLVADLFEQGWGVSFEADQILFAPPGIARGAGETIDDIKARVRQALQAARLRQLQEPSVRSFFDRVEKRKTRGGHKASVVDLIDNGADLARECRNIAKLPEADREAALAALIRPEIEICDASARCADTGLPLNDIWRYFRHTWAHEYRSIPGRQMLVLIRNAARPNRPVMGIAMLASPVMRLAARDQWIGWLREAAEGRVADGLWVAEDLAGALIQRIEDSLAVVRWDDLATPSEVSRPTETVALRLEQRAAGAIFARDAELKAHFESESGREGGDGTIRPHRGNLDMSNPDMDWIAASNDLLFVRKRAESMAQLLFAKRVFRESRLKRWPAQALQRLFASRDGRRAIDIALAEFRKAGLSSEVADVSICGAVHPYSQLLGGKLVALLLATREIHEGYAARYGRQVSVIASQMAGRPVSKPANLQILTTTSLYGVGSSQYNRLHLRAADHDGLGHDIRWGAIGKSLTGGFGTLHLGNETAHALRSVAFARHDARRVNNRFGEGTSPRMRQIREGLDALGIKSDAILHHATPRIFYGCELSPGARSGLVGLLTPNKELPTCSNVAAAWRKRWLMSRIAREDTLDSLQSLGPTSVLASLHADPDGQFRLPIA